MKGEDCWPRWCKRLWQALIQVNLLTWALQVSLVSDLALNLELGRGLSLCVMVPALGMLWNEADEQICMTRSVVDL